VFVIVVVGVNDVVVGVGVVDTSIITGIGYVIGSAKWRSKYITSERSHTLSSGPAKSVLAISIVLCAISVSICDNG
jgi:hypothetical protein